MNKQTLVELNSDNLDKINKLLDEGFNLGHHISVGNITFVVLNKYEINTPRAGYAPFAPGCY